MLNAAGLRPMDQTVALKMAGWPMRIRRCRTWDELAPWPIWRNLKSLLHNGL